MTLSTPTELHETLRLAGARPQKRFSQNFLIDPNIARKIVESASIRPGEQVLEIGPGAGALTELILLAGASLAAVEKDRNLTETLRTRFPQVSLYQDDILNFDLDLLKGRCKVVANLPYHLTSPILERLLPRPELFSELTLMVQKEVAQRITSTSGASFSPLSIFCQFYSTPKILFNVSRKVFYPAPKVDSAVVQFRLERRATPFDPEGFFQLVRTAFQQRRKMLSTSLKPLFAQGLIQEGLSSLDLDPRSRPEDLTGELWLQFASKLLT